MNFAGAFCLMCRTHLVCGRFSLYCKVLVVIDSESTNVMDSLSTGVKALSVLQSKNAVCAFEITYEVLYFTLDDS